MATLKIHGLGDYIRDQRVLAQVSLRQLARQAGVSNPYLSQIERGLRKPSAEILQQIAKALRISAEALYIQAGILDERDAEGTVPAAVLADATISERQKQVLLEIYESFRKENDIRAEAEPAEAPAAPRPRKAPAKTASAAGANGAAASGPATPVTPVKAAKATAAKAVKAPAKKATKAAKATAAAVKAVVADVAADASTDVPAGHGVAATGTSPGATTKTDATEHPPTAAPAPATAATETGTPVPAEPATGSETATN